MKVAALFTAILACASAFAPAPVNTRSSTELNALFDSISDMDLFAPFKEVNDYGARGKKQLKQGKLTGSSYVPDGLTRVEYQRIREQEKAKADANYQRNVAKAGKFLDFTKFYLDRGTNENGSWMKQPNRGHRMAKTKYDFSGGKDEQKVPESIGLKLKL